MINKASVLYVDPPWTFKTYSDKGRGRSADNHYNCLTFEDLCAMQVEEIAAKDCTLLLWVTDPMLPKGLELIKAWGFEYKTVGFYWAKVNKHAEIDSINPTNWFTGMGYYTRSNPEQCLLATRGKPQRKSMSVRKLCVAKRREHSRKPDEIYERIESLLHGPYVELFSRTNRPGWTQWGDEVGKWTQ